MATNFFQSPSNTPPPSNDDQNFCPRGHGGHEFLFKNDIRCTSIYFGDQKNLVVPPLLDGDRKGWGLCYQFVGKKIFPRFPSWATKEFWSPSNDVGVLNGDENSSIGGYVGWQSNVFDRHLIHPYCLMATKFFFGCPKRHGVKGMK
jgi:hypothetical protein